MFNFMMWPFTISGWHPYVMLDGQSRAPRCGFLPSSFWRKIWTNYHLKIFSQGLMMPSLDLSQSCRHTEKC